MIDGAARGRRGSFMGSAEQLEPLVAVNAADSAVSGAAAGGSLGAADAAADAAAVAAAGAESSSTIARAAAAAAREAAAGPLVGDNLRGAATEPLLRVGAVETVAGEGPERRDIENQKRVNVLLTLAFTVLNTFFFSCAQGPVFDMYIFILGHKSNMWVGNTESMSGVVALLVAAPVGIVVDKYSRSKICKALCVFGLLATVTSIWGVGRDCLSVIILSLALWGVFGEATSSATNALFADSLSRGDRTKWFTWKGMLASAAWAVAPLLMICFFVSFGDDWDLSRVRTLIVVGCFLFGPSSSLLLWFFSDVLGVRERSSTGGSRHDRQFSGSAQLLMRLQHIWGYFFCLSLQSGRPAVADSRGFSHSVAAAATTNEMDSAAAAVGGDAAAGTSLGVSSALDSDEQLARLSWLHRSVPYIISVADLVRALGAGMTVKFFPLFFTNEYHLTPVQLCVVALFYALSIVLFIYIIEKLSKYTGRALASQLLSFLGLVMLGVMCVAVDLRFLILAHLLRGGMQNAIYPIDRSLIVDFTKSKDRGKWSAVETFTSTMWSGSAFLGGIMADTDYRFAFKVTAAVYAVALFIYSPLVFIVPKAERALGLDHGRPSVAPADSSGTSRARDPRVSAEQLATSRPRSEASAAAAAAAGSTASVFPSDSIDLAPFSEGGADCDLEARTASPCSGTVSRTPSGGPRETLANPNCSISEGPSKGE